MKKNTLKIDKKTLSICLICLVAGFLLANFLMVQKVNYQKTLTKRILNNSLKSMAAYKEISDSCSSAYNTAATCVSNLNTCDLKTEAIKLDDFNASRKHADRQINLLNQDMAKIIQEVSNKR